MLFGQTGHYAQGWYDQETHTKRYQHYYGHTKHTIHASIYRSSVTVLLQFDLPGLELDPGQFSGVDRFVYITPAYLDQHSTIGVFQPYATAADPEKTMPHLLVPGHLIRMITAGESIAEIIESGLRAEFVVIVDHDHRNLNSTAASASRNL